MPLAPRRTVLGGLTASPGTRHSASVRIRQVGTRPAEASGRVEALGHTVTESNAVWPRGCLGITVAADNLFNVAWNEAQFATTSRLRDEAGPVTDLHFTPGSPRTAMVALRLGC